MLPGSSITAFILAGGHAKKMGNICNNIPKSMLPISGFPFLFWIVNWLIKKDIPIIISTGPQYEYLEKCFIPALCDTSGVIFAQESFHLGTGGAVKNAALYTDSKYVIVFNGDTILKTNVENIIKFHESHDLPITQIVSRKSVQNEGAIIINSSGIVLEYLEWKALSRERIIYDSYHMSSTGCYVFNRNFVIENFPNGPISLEIELMPDFVYKKLVKSFINSTQCFDFGTPERYLKLKNITRHLLINAYGNISTLPLMKDYVMPQLEMEF